MGETTLTFDDVSVIPGYSDVLPKEVDVSVQISPHIKLNIPILSSAMDTVTESRMAIALAQLGGIGVIHKNMSIEEQSGEVRTVKRFDGGIVKEPLVVYPGYTLSQVKEMSVQTGFSSFPVVIDYSKYNSAKRILVGLITARDIKFQTRDDVKVADIMTPIDRLITAAVDLDMPRIKSLMFAHKVEKIPVVRLEGETPLLVGLATLKDMEIAATFPNAIRDASGKLIVAAAIGVSVDSKERAAALVDAGVDALVVDSAHGHSKGVLDLVGWLTQTFPDIDVIAGNVVTREALRSLCVRGAHSVKVGIGPGCFVPGTRVTTRNGMTPIEEINEGTEVLTHRGRWKKVVGKSAFSDKKEVTVVNGIASTTDHKYYVIHKQHKSSVTDENLHSLAEWIEAKDLTKDYLLIKPKGKG